MNHDKLKIFISGANGFLGRNLNKQLIKNYNLLTPNKKKLNLTDRISLKNYLKKERPEIIIHLAASTKFKSTDINEKKNQITNTLNTTKNLVNCINSECKLIIFFGSIEEYGLSISPFNENQVPKPLSMYGKYKYKSYLYASKLLKKKKLNYIWFRPCLIFGYGDNNQRYLGHIINSIKKNKKIVIYPGNQIRDYMHVDDLVKVLNKVIKNYKKKYNLILNISAKNHIKLKSIPIMIEKIIKKKINFIIKDRNKKQVDLYNSNTKLLKLFPDLKFLSFKRGLIKTLKDESIL